MSRHSWMQRRWRTANCCSRLPSLRSRYLWCHKSRITKTRSNFLIVLIHSLILLKLNIIRTKILLRYRRIIHWAALFTELLFILDAATFYRASQQEQRSAQPARNRQWAPTEPSVWTASSRRWSSDVSSVLSSPAWTLAAVKCQVLSGEGRDESAKVTILLSSSLQCSGVRYVIYGWCCSRPIRSWLT